MTAAPFAGLEPPYVLLEDRLGEAAAGGLLYARPRSIVRCDDPGGLERAFDALERGLASGLHAAGMLSYELGYAMEPRLSPLTPEARDTPLLWLGLFDPPARIGAEALDAHFAGLGPPSPLRLGAAQPRSVHMAKVEEALRLIEAGDIYQVNLTFPVPFSYGGDPLRLYAALRARQPVAHGGVLALGELTALSASPELWVEIADGRATARPMKGTCARGEDAAADANARAALSADPKQRAENLMIVDLLRNDLARISVPGSVRTPALFTVETYPSFHTLTSTVVGVLRAGVSLKDRIAALFPCGSIVGAPKIRAAEVIRALEPAPRGIYTGALGAMAPNGDMKFNVAIRTAVLKADGEGLYGVGGGVVADSDPGAEYDEAMLKARVLTDLAEDYDLIETFRWSAEDGFTRLPLHLDRLERSARALGFGFDRASAEAMVRRVSEPWERDEGDRRVRLLLKRDGRLEVGHAALTRSKPRLRVGLATHRLDPGDPFLRHKTTCRERYESAFQAAATAGLDEAMFLNRRGEVAEASRNTVFVELHGRLVTPPLSSGVLPGVLRGVLLAEGKAVEGVVLPETLRSGRWWLGNSLHGLRRAELATPERNAALD